MSTQSVQLDVADLQQRVQDTSTARSDANSVGQCGLANPLLYSQAREPDRSRFAWPGRRVVPNLPSATGIVPTLWSRRPIAIGDMARESVGSGDGGEVGVARLTEGVEGAVAAAADGAFVDAEVVGDVVAGCVAVAAAGFEVEGHQQVLERRDAVSAGPEQQVDDVDVIVVRVGGVEVLESRVLGIDA